MASFPVHLSVAMAASGICATSLLVTGLSTPTEVAFYFVLGMAGGVSPDLDSDNSTPFRTGSKLLSLLGASLFMLSLGNRLSVVELCIVWLLVFFILRYGLFYTLTHFTVHRGVLHTIPAAMLFGFLTTITVYRLGVVVPFQAWIAGTFVMFGYIIHLILDEIYSVDIYGAQIKRSFGTALKFFAPRSPMASILLYVVLVGAWQFTPDIQPFLTTFSNIHLWQRLESRLLPNNGWFK